MLNIWRKSVEEGTVPDQLKTGLITPLYKGGDKTQPKSYRPITLTSHLIKIFERIVCNNIKAYLTKIDAWNENQHGFRKGRSCLTQLLDHYHRIIDALENENSVDVIYLDFCKAFDKVDHEVLLQKLSSIGIRSYALRWIGDFLIGRKQAVCVDGAISSYVDVGSGVPQGSVVGPLLFLIHIADIDYMLKYSEATSFADDTRLLMKVRSYEECAKFQHDLDSVYLWSAQNKMSFNETKFVHLHYSHPKIDAKMNYRGPRGDTILEEQHCRDLGVEMSTDVIFSQHMDEAVLKANRQCSWILRTFSSREPHLMLVLFKQLVLPMLEYCCQLWSPVGLGEIRKIEAVQRSFSNKMSGMENWCYWSRLKLLNLYSLERRRDRYLILYTFKIMKGLVPNLAEENLRIKFEHRGRRGLLCEIPLLNRGAMARYKTLKDRSLAVRGPRLFNCLPSNLRDMNLSLASFKRKLDTFFVNVPDQPPLLGPEYAQPAKSNSVEDQLEELRRKGIFFQ